MQKGNYNAERETKTQKRNYSVETKTKVKKRKLQFMERNLNEGNKTIMKRRNSLNKIKFKYSFKPGTI